VRKNLSAIGNSLGIIIEKPILELLGITRDTELEVMTDGTRLIVVQDAASYQRMLDLIDRAETIEDVRGGIESVREGKTMSLDQFDKEMRKNIHVPKKRFMI